MLSTTIESAAAESSLVRDALEMAGHVHEGQVRSGSGGMAYIHHPVAVAELLAEQGHGEQVVAAALLHDVVEDGDVSVEELADRFGQEISQLVATLSEDESVEPYERRKGEHRDRVAAEGGDALAIYAADKLSNVRVLRRAYESLGEAAGDDLKAPLDAKEAVWAADLEMLRRECPDLPFVDELARELAELREARATRAPTSSS